MKLLARLIFIFIALMFSAIAADKSIEEQEFVCDEGDYSEDLFISIAEIHERLVSLSWPDIPSIARRARMSATAVFKIKVSTSGEVCSIESMGGSPIFIPPLMLEIKKWKFLPNSPFEGVIAVRYTSKLTIRNTPGNKGFRLL